MITWPTCHVLCGYLLSWTFHVVWHVFNLDNQTTSNLKRKHSWRSWALFESYRCQPSGMRWQNVNYMCKKGRCNYIVNTNIIWCKYRLIVLLHCWLLKIADLRPSSALILHLSSTIDSHWLACAHFSSWIHLYLFIFQGFHQTEHVTPHRNNQSWDFWTSKQWFKDLFFLHLIEI